jgi:hypothetical protein
MHRYTIGYIVIKMPTTVNTIPMINKSLDAYPKLKVFKVKADAKSKGS